MKLIGLNNFHLFGVTLIFIAVVIVTVVFPTLAPPTFFIACCAMLFIAAWIHRSEFRTQEYERNTFKYTLRNNASNVVIFIAILGIVGFWYFSQNNTAYVGPAPIIPSLPTVGGGLTSVAKNAVSRIKEVMRTGNISD